MLWLIPMVAAEDVISRDWTVAIGDVVNMRSAPGERARLVAQVPIGTTFFVEEQGAEWTRVEVVDRPAEHALVGWVRNDLLTNRLGSAETLVDKAKATDDPAESKMWLDRARAADPWNGTVVRELGEPSGPIWIGQCDGERVWLVGRANPRDLSVQSAMTGPDGLYLPLEQHEKIARSLGTVAWYQGGGRYPGRFITPFVAPINAIDDTEASDAWSNAAELGDGVQVEVVVGACDPYERGQVYTTAPLEPLSSVPAGFAGVRNALAVAARSAGEVSGVVARLGPTGGTEIALMRQATMDSCGGDGEVGMGTFWTWAAADGVATEPFIVNFDGDVGTGTGLAAWYAWRGVPVGFVYGSGMESVTSVIRLDDEGHGRVEHLAFRYFGC